ncbi:MAG: hypothetical protein PVI78_04970 [Anaerolineales bacterium]|jgi:hypothetical protein
MKKIRFVVLLIVILSLVSVAASVQKRVGERINLIGPAYQTFEANAPFHIAHGWGCYFIITEFSGYACGAGISPFTLMVDGQPVQFSFLDVSLINHVLYEGEYWRYRESIWIYNFPAGMEGTHTFTGTWWNQCKDVYGDACEKPNQLVPTTRTVVVEFVAP